METDGHDRALTLDQAAARLGISRDAMRKRLERGSVPGAVKVVGRPWSIPADALDRPTVRQSTDATVRTVQSDTSELLSELRAIRLLLERVADVPATALQQPLDARDGRTPGRPAPWWRWLLFGEVRAK
jgi:excisionase family DNA binding protein